MLVMHKIPMIRRRPIRPFQWMAGYPCCWGQVLRMALGGTETCEGMMDLKSEQLSEVKNQGKIQYYLLSK
jgi:hypothetical protein